MPLQRIDLTAGRAPEQRRAIADAVHRSLVETCGVPEQDRFQIVEAHERGVIAFAPEYLGIRHQDPVLVQITLNTGRTLEQKQRLYRRMAELCSAAGVPANDLVVSLVEVTKENWSFGEGVAQYAPAAPPG
jgi:phenylpyruvate tautomerase PptA (4-oxalocrotonate tautomerase family)